MQTPPERSDPESASTGHPAGVKVSNRPVPLATILTEKYGFELELGIGGTIQPLMLKG